MLRKVERVETSTTSRVTRGVEQTKARKNKTETCLQRAERLEVFSKPKRERLRWRHVYNEQSRDVADTTLRETGFNWIIVYWILDIPDTG